MRVYGWLAFHPKTNKQVRCIMAGTLREVQETCRMLNIWPGRAYLAQTGNKNETQQAEMAPGRVLWAPNDFQDHTFQDWAASTRDADPSPRRTG